MLTLQSQVCYQNQDMFIPLTYLESRTLVTGFSSSSKVNATMIHRQSQVKEATSSLAMIDQTHTFSIEKLLLKSSELFKMLIKIGSEMNPVRQEQLIEHLYREGYPQEIEIENQTFH